MTEEEWLSCLNPRTMLNFLRATVSSRKLRLLICARYRREWCQLTDERERRAVEVAERLADGMVNLQEQLNAHFAASDAMLEKATKNILISPCVAEATSHHKSIDDAISLAISSAETLVSRGDWQLLHCLFGNPFRLAVLNLDWLSWNDGLVRRLAQTAYDERHLPIGNLDNARLLVLADALEEAGCGNADILAHCRQPGEHVRGCWVVDLLLNKS